MKILFFCALFLSLCACEPAVKSEPAAALAAASPLLLPESELLAESVIVAEYLGTEEHPCRFMTADCPDKCGHATKVALFRVISGESYAAHSEYGDPKPEAGEIVPVDIAHPAPGQVAIPALNKGDKVKLTIQHRYTKGNVQEPIRPVTAIEKL